MKNRMEYKVYSSELPSLLEDMAEYVANLEDECERTHYFNEIANTGLFHDAIGKVIAQEKETEVTIVDEY